MHITVIGLGAQRPSSDFDEILDSGPVFARNGGQARSWLGASDYDLVDLSHVFDRSAVETIADGIVEAFGGAETTAACASYLVPGMASIGDCTVELLATHFEVAVISGSLGLSVPLGNLHIVDGLSIALAESAWPYDAGQISVDPTQPMVATNMVGDGVVPLASQRLVRAFGRSPSDVANDTWLFLPAVEPVGQTGFPGLEQVVATLRGPNGCPWDQEQTIESLVPQLEEELGEFVEAHGSGNGEDAAEELGDVLLHIVMISQIGHESGAFSSADVIRSISTKMIRRHPHVFGDRQIDSIEELYEMWEEIKEREKAVVGECMPASSTGE